MCKFTTTALFQKLSLKYLCLRLGIVISSEKKGLILINAPNTPTKSRDGVSNFFCSKN